MQNGQVYATPVMGPRSHPPTPSSHGALDHAAAPVRRASYPASISTCSPTTNHQRSHSQSQLQSYPHFYTHGAIMAPPGVNGLPTTTHMQAPPHVSSLHQIYQEQTQLPQQQQQQQLVHGFYPPHAHHVIAHAASPIPPAPAPPLSTSHPNPRPAHHQANPQQQPQQQLMTHAPTTDMLIPANVPAPPPRPSPTSTTSTTEQQQSLAQLRAQATAPAATAGSLAMQLAAATRLREQVQAQATAAVVPVSAPTAVASASVNATAAAASNSANSSASAGVGAIAVPSTPGPGTQTKAPLSRTFPMLPPASGRAQQQQQQPPAPSASNSPPSQQQQHHQRFTMPPAIAAFKVLQPAKDLLEQTWAAAIAAVQQEFAAVSAELSRSAREKQALTELLQRMQGERMQTMHALRSTQTELRQCTFGVVVFFYI